MVNHLSYCTALCRRGGHRRLRRAARRRRWCLGLRALAPDHHHPVASGPAGAELTVNGYAVTGTAEIRGNALDGPLLAKADGPVFWVPGTVPAVRGRSLHRADARARPGRCPRQHGRGGVPGHVGQRGPREPGEVPMTSKTIASVPSSSSVPAGAALIGGAGLLALGAIAGAVGSRHRRGNLGERTSIQP